MAQFIDAVSCNHTPRPGHPCCGLSFFHTDTVHWESFTGVTLCLCFPHWLLVGGL